MFTATDLVIPGRLPVVWSRTYRSGESLPGPFGIGTTLAYDDYLYGPGGDVMTYVSRGNALTPFTRQADGSYVNTAVPAFRGARFTGTPGGNWTLRRKDGRAITFDNQGLMIQVQDRAGNTVTIDRSAGTNPARVIDPAGRALTATWVNTLNRDLATSVTDPLGRTVWYDYDPQNRLTKVTNPANGFTLYAYDPQHRMTSITDARGIVFLRNTYDTNSRVCEQQQADSGWFRFFYITTDRATLPESLQLLSEAAAGGPITQTPCSAATATTAPVAATVLVDPRGKPTTYRFNGQQFLIQVTDALGQVTTYTRQADTNLLLSITDPLNRVTQFQYDATGNVTQLTDAANQVWTATLRGHLQSGDLAHRSPGEPHHLRV
jgi:YD repeat-containing protein